jgi:hypothetical protein
MKYLILTCTFLLIFNLVFSQDSLNPDKPNTFSISLLELIPFGEQNTANFNLGKEFNLKENHSIYLNIGYLHSYGLPFMEKWFGPLFSHIATDSRGVKIQIEKKKYLNKQQKEKFLYFLFWPHIFQPATSYKNSGYYFSLGAIGSFLITEENYYRIYKLHRDEYILNVQYGYKGIMDVGLVLDFSMGIGVQFVNSYTTDKIIDNYLTLEYFEENKKSFNPFWFIVKMRAGWNFS